MEIHDPPDQKPTNRNQGKGNLNCNWRTAESSVWPAWETQTPGDLVRGDPHTFVSFTSRSSTGSSQWISEKNLFTFPSRGGEKEVLEDARVFTFFSTRPALRRNYLFAAWSVGVLSVPKLLSPKSQLHLLQAFHLGVGEYWIPTYSSNTVYLLGRELISTWPQFMNTSSLKEWDLTIWLYNASPPLYTLPPQH